MLFFFYLERTVFSANTSCFVRIYFSFLYSLHIICKWCAYEINLEYFPAKTCGIEVYNNHKIWKRSTFVWGRVIKPIPWCEKVRKECEIKPFSLASCLSVTPKCNVFFTSKLYFLGGYTLPLRQHWIIMVRCIPSFVTLFAWSKCI